MEDLPTGNTLRGYGEKRSALLESHRPEFLWLIFWSLVGSFCRPVNPLPVAKPAVNLLNPTLDHEKQSPARLRILNINDTRLTNHETPVSHALLGFNKERLLAVDCDFNSHSNLGIDILYK